MGKEIVNCYLYMCVCMHVYVREWMVWGAGAINQKIPAHMDLHCTYAV